MEALKSSLCDGTRSIAFPVSFSVFAKLPKLQAWCRYLFISGIYTFFSNTVTFNLNRELKNLTMLPLKFPGKRTLSTPNFFYLQLFPFSGVATANHLSTPNIPSKKDIYRFPKREKLQEVKFTSSHKIDSWSLLQLHTPPGRISPSLFYIYVLYNLQIALLMRGRQVDPWPCATQILLKWLGNLPRGGLEF